MTDSSSLYALVADYLAIVQELPIVLSVYADDSAIQLVSAETDTPESVAALVGDLVLELNANFPGHNFRPCTELTDADYAEDFGFDLEQNPEHLVHKAYFIIWDRSIC